MEEVLALRRASRWDVEELYKLQVLGYIGLLEKYRDFDTNPATETPERILREFYWQAVDFYFVLLGARKIGALRVSESPDGACILSHFLILPEYRGKGYAGEVLRLLEAHYPDAVRWSLTANRDDPKLRHLFKKAGYRLTGNIRYLGEGLRVGDFIKDMPRDASSQ